jgi:exosortase
METVSKKSLWGLAAPAACFILLYYKVIASLMHDWSVDDNYSHGFFIVPIALYFAWERRVALKEAVRNASAWGLVLVVCSLAMLVAGILGVELFLTRVSMLGVLAGGILFLFGWNHIKILIFPVAFLLLMIPIPAIVFNQVAFPLQLLASQFGEGALIVSHIPVLREGNVIHLANTSLEVAEACSGIRSLISLLTLGIVYGYFMDARLWVRVLLAVGTIPIAIIANGIRVAGTGIAAHFYGEAAAEGFFHTFSGWLVFVASFIMMFVLYEIIVFIAPKRKGADPVLSESDTSMLTSSTEVDDQTDNEITKK